MSLPKQNYRLHEVQERVHQENDDEEELSDGESNLDSQDSIPRLNFAGMGNFQQDEAHHILRPI